MGAWYWEALGLALVGTLEMSLFSILIALPLGLCIGVIKSTRFSWIATSFTEIFCNIPLIVQLFILYFVMPEFIPGLAAIDNNVYVFIVGLLGLTLYSSAKMANHFYAGIKGVGEGQWLAAKSLQLSVAQLYYYISIPIAMRRILPSLCNEVMSVFKNSAIVSAIGFIELTKESQRLIADAAGAYAVLMITLFLYVLINSIVIVFFKFLEKRYKIKGSV